MSSEQADSERPDFVALHDRFETKLTPGQRAELRRVAEPDDLVLMPALYALFPGLRPTGQHRRLAFLLPCCSHKAGVKSLGSQLAEHGIAEARVLQTVRAKAPMDLIQLRRLVVHLSPTVDWGEFGKTLWYWGERSKRTLVEDYFLAHSISPKGAKK